MALTIDFKMYESGWAGLIFQADEQKCHINLSDVFSPFKNILAWGALIDQGQFPAVLEINEEGHVMTLTAIRACSNDSELMINLTCTGSYMQKIYVDQSIAQVDFVRQLKQEIIRFFQDDFEPSHWHVCGYDAEDEAFKSSTLKQDILSNSWICHV